MAGISLRRLEASSQWPLTWAHAASTRESHDVGTDLRACMSSISLRTCATTDAPRSLSAIGRRHHQGESHDVWVDIRSLNVVEELAVLLPMAVDLSACVNDQGERHDAWANIRSLDVVEELDGLRPMAVDLAQASITTSSNWARSDCTDAEASGAAPRTNYEPSRRPLRTCRGQPCSRRRPPRGGDRTEERTAWHVLRSPRQRSQRRD